MTTGIPSEPHGDREREVETSRAPGRLEVLMRTAIEQAGADRGLLVLSRWTEPRIAAQGTTGDGGIVVRLHDEAMTPEALPESVIQHVVRTNEAVILDDAAAENPYSADPYLRQQRARSILCLPLLDQGQRIGVLYLENNLTPGAFGPARVAVLELLASQAAISLENVRLRRELAELRAIIDNAPVFLWSDLPDGYCDFLNQPWLAYFSLSLPEAQGSGWAALLHPDDAAHHLESWQKAVARGLPFETEARYRRADGEYRWFLNRANPRRDETGRIVKWYGTNIDIENLKRTEARLRQSEADLRRSQHYLAEAQKVSHTGSWAWSPASNALLYWSEECYRILGYDPAQDPPSFESSFQRIHPEDQPALVETIERAVREKAEFQIGYRLVLPDGTRRNVHIQSHPVLDASGQLVEFIGTVMDVTEQKRAEEERREHLWFLESMDRVNRAMQRTNDVEGMMSGVLEETLAIFGSDRARLVYPCDPDAATCRVVMEHSRPEYPGAFALGEELPMDPPAAQLLRRALDGPGAVTDVGSSPEIRERFRIQSAIAIAVRPKGDRPYLFGMHQCSHVRTWTAAERRLFEEIARRLEDALTSVLAHRSLLAREEELRRLYRDLAEREAKIRRLVDANIIGIFIWELEGRILEANDAFLTMLGYDREDLAAGGLHWRELTPPEWRDNDVRRLIPELMVSGTLQPFEKEYFRKDGRRVPVLIGIATFEEKGSQGVAFVLDLTERKRSEQRRLTHHHVTRILAEAVTVEEAAPKILQAVCEGLGWDVGAWWRIDRDTEVLRCAELWQGHSVEAAEFPAATRASTFPPGSGLPGQVWASGAPAWIPDVVRDPTFLRASIAAREGLHAAYAFPLLLGDEVVGVLDFVSREVREPDQTLLDSLATLGSQIGQFIERKRAEQALRESEREARLIVNTIPGLVAVLTPTGELDVVNDQLREYFGQPLEDLRQWRMNETFHPEDLPRVGGIIGQGIASGEAFVYEARIRRFDGLYRWFQFGHLPLRDTLGRVARWYALLSDIDDRKRAEAEVREAYTELAHVARVTTMGELTASIAHEVRQPIAAAVTSAQTALRWLEAQPPELGEVREALSRIVRAGKRAEDVIGRIRALVTKAPPRKEPVEINAAIREVVELTRGEAVKNGVSVRTDLAEDLPLIQGDRVQLQQVMLNLIINGIEAMTGVGEASRDLLISSKTNDADGVLVAVADTGPGLAAGAPAQMFAAFYTTKPGGLGLGLSICRSIIEAHEGQLWASANDPHGARFEFTLPVRPDGDR